MPNRSQQPTSFLKLLRRIKKNLLPPGVSKVYNWVLSKTPARANTLKYAGDYSWEEAVAKSGGYEDSKILDVVAASIKKVINGEAAYERDSVTFNKVQVNWPLQASLLHIANSRKNKLSVLDFGGSLGTTFYQVNNQFGRDCIDNWFIVEQPHFVKRGKAEFENSKLKFEYHIEDVLQKSQVNCLLLSGVLQCLEHPYEWISKLLAYKFEYIILDRISFIHGRKERLTIQIVPPSIYESSYPIWFFVEEKFMQQFLVDYELLSSFESVADPESKFEDGKKGYWQGFLFRLRLRNQI